MTTFQRETYDSVIEEIQPLLEKHWLEIAHFKDIELAPYWDAYRTAETAGKLRVFTARRDCLIGYAIFFIGSLHYMTTKIASQDVLFVDPAHRGLTGARLIKFCDEYLKAEGAQAIYHHVKVAHNFGPMLERMGYEAVDVVYGRRL